MKKETEADWPEDKENAFQRFLEHFPLNSDITLMLLKAHLLIEEEVNTLLSMFVNDEKELRSASLSFCQKICILKSLYPPELHGNLLQAEKLNRIRNKIAHNLDPTGLSDSLKSFCELFTWEEAKLKESNAESLLPTALARLHAGFSGYKSAFKGLDLRTFKTPRN
jgi:hypothetical protein